MEFLPGKKQTQTGFPSNSAGSEKPASMLVVAREDKQETGNTGNAVLSQSGA